MGPTSVYVSVDGTDFPINEPQPFSPSWYSHKFHGPGVRYEIGLSVASGRIIWVNGSFKCGAFPDNKSFCIDMKNCPRSDESVIADCGYTDARCITKRSKSIPGHHKIHKLIRAMHETVNHRLKTFNVIRDIFRHDLSKHQHCFHAVAQLTSIMIDTTNPLFKIKLAQN